MPLHSLQAIHSNLHAMPVALMFTTRLLLTYKVSEKVKSGSPEPKTEQYTVRANQLSELLKNIEGYSHGGLND